MTRKVAIGATVVAFVLLFPAFCVSGSASGGGATTQCDSLLLGPVGISLPDGVDYLVILGVIAAIWILSWKWTKS
jgi:hypothetical protein